MIEVEDHDGRQKWSPIRTKGCRKKGISEKGRVKKAKASAARVRRFGGAMRRTKK